MAPILLHCIAILLAFLLLIESFAGSMISITLVEKPNVELYEKIQANAEPVWYVWTSICLNMTSVVLMIFVIIGIGVKNIFIFGLTLVAIMISLLIDLSLHAVLYWSNIQLNQLMIANIYAAALLSMVFIVSVAEWLRMKREPAPDLTTPMYTWDSLDFDPYLNRNENFIYF